MSLTSVALRTAPVAAAVLCSLFALPAHAHPGVHHASGLSAGFFHPLTGWDHLLAMLAVGMWAAQQRRAAWGLLVAFPAAMAFGALLALGGLALPLVEPGIAASVLVLGLLVAFAVRMPTWASAAMVALFALFHGFAHGSELPMDASFVAYGAGFLIATLGLHLAGAAGARTVQNLHAAVVRAAGAGVALAGAWMLAPL